MRLIFKRYGIIFLMMPFLFAHTVAMAQVEDSANNERLAKMVTMTEVVLRSNLDISRFIEQVKNDTSFYKAFRNLHLLEFTSSNDIRIRDKEGVVKASLLSKTKQRRENDCRSMQVLEERTTGDFYTITRGYNYYTAQLYAGLFFTKGTVCGENNIVKGRNFVPRSESGIDKHKEQLKMLFFNPGKKIPGIPFIGDKIDIFDPTHASLYDFSLDYADYENQACYVFSIKAKKDLGWFDSNKIVIDSMITWFNCKTMEVVARNYAMSYDAGVYDFDVKMEVEMTHVRDLLVPRTLRYIGNWDVALKKRERGVFTATLYDFN
jgi:hypothetical protein